MSIDVIIHTKLQCKRGESNMDKEKCIIEYMPEKTWMRLSEIVYFYLVYLVPKGRLTRYDDIVKYLEKKFDVHHVEFCRPFNLSWDYWCKFIDHVPLHRVVSSRGYTEPLNKAKLISEEIIIEETTTGNRGPRVKDYKKYLFDFEKETDISLDFLKKINEQQDFDVT